SHHRAGESANASPLAHSLAKSGASPTPTASAVSWLRRASSWKIGPTVRPSGGGASVDWRSCEPALLPSPSHACGAGPSLSRGAGEGLWAALFFPFPHCGRGCLRAPPEGG